MTCIDAFKNLSIINQQGQLQISPCCISPAVNTSTVDFYQNLYLDNVRDDWNKGRWPSACNVCKKSEQQGFASRRIGSNQWYADHNISNTTPELIRLDYWVGNLCNLACVICNPDNSSRWREELKLPIELKKLKINKFWKSLDLSLLKFIHFHGGEPLLSKEHVEMLQSIPNKSSVQVTYNTNGTICADPALLELWSQFKLIHVDFSIDDIGARFEYQRFPAVWATVVQNLQWYINHAPHNTMFGINATVSRLNHHSLPDLKAWAAENFSTNRFSDPIEFRTQPAAGNFSLDNTLSSVRKYLDAIDQRRGTNWKEIFPELT